MTVNTASFREALAHVPTAVSVITTVDSCDKAWGVTVGTLCSLSLSPPLVLFCLDRGNASHDVFTGAARFLVHVLRDHQADVANWFARRGGHDFDDDLVTLRGLPSIPDTLARLVCLQSRLIQGGDHTIVIGLVESVEICAGRPLLHYARRYCAVAGPAPDPATPLALSPPQAVAGLREPPARRRMDRPVGQGRPLTR